MPKNLQQLDRDTFCSAPPLSTSSLCPPRLTRETEARRPRAPIFEVKREVTSSIESAEFVQDEDFDVKPPVKVELDPRQLRAGIAALAIDHRPASPSSSTSGETGAPGPSNWGVRSVPLNGRAIWAQRPHPGAEAVPRGPRPGQGWRSTS